METPHYSHLTSKDYAYVYEPSEDTFLLIDALENELPFLNSRKPLVTAEIGPGSGIVISALAKYLDYQNHGFFAVDINRYACEATKRTAFVNNVNVEVSEMDLLTAFKPNSIDLLIFNPPYVPTLSEEQTVQMLEQRKLYDKEAAENFYEKSEEEKCLIKSWAGGAKGCEILNRVLERINDILAENGIFYLLLIKDNEPEKIKNKLNRMDFQVEQIMDRKIRGEHLLVFKIFKNKQ